MFRPPLVASLCLFTLATLPVASTAQPQAATVPTTARRTVSKTTVAKGKEQALATIQGNALTSTSGHMSDALVRLRDARFGQIVETQLTDKSGMFTFKGIDPGSYVVEVMGPDASIAAASQLLTVNAGETVSALVKLPFRLAPSARFAGQGTSTSSALLLTTVAASSGIAAIVPTTPVSPVK
jgi:hypothetical protein